MKWITFITGTTGSGKTTMTNYLGRMGWSTLHTGSLFRKMMPHIKSGESIIAPESFDHVVHEQAIRFIDTHMRLPTSQFIALEAVPRNEGQLRLVEYVINKYPNAVVNVLVLDAPLTVRMHRVKSRGLMQTDRDVKTDTAKLAAEKYFTTDMVDMLGNRGIGYNVVDTVDNDYSHTPLHNYSLGNMIEAAQNFHRLKTGEDREPSISRMIERCGHELKEAQGVLNGANPLALVEELVDALWFLLLALNTATTGESEIYHRYMQKYGVNTQLRDHGSKPHVKMESQ